MSARASGEESSDSQPTDSEPVADGLPLFADSLGPVQDTQEPDLLSELMGELEKQLPDHPLPPVASPQIPSPPRDRTIIEQSAASKPVAEADVKPPVVGMGASAAVATPCRSDSLPQMDPKPSAATSAQAGLTL